MSKSNDAAESPSNVKLTVIFKYYLLEHDIIISHEELTCRFIRWVRSPEATVWHRCISAENNGHGVAWRSHLGASWNCSTETLQEGCIACQTIQYLKDTDIDGAR